MTTKPRQQRLRRWLEGFKTPFGPERERGNTIIMVVVFAGFMLAVAGYMTDTATWRSQAIKNSENLGDQAYLKQFILTNLSCHLTFEDPPDGTTPPDCTGATEKPLHVRDRSGRIFIIDPTHPLPGEPPRERTMLGHYQLRAWCRTIGGQVRLRIEAFHFQANLEDPALNPLTRQPTTWTDLLPSTPWATLASCS